MTSQLSDDDANNLLDVILSHSASNFPTNWYFALVTTAPSDNTGAGIVEVTGAGYARVAIAADNASFSAATARGKVSGIDITWPTAAVDWAADPIYVVGVALYDDATAGNYRGYGELAAPVNILTGAAPVIASGDFTMTA